MIKMKSQAFYLAHNITRTIAKELPATSPQTVPSRSSEAQFKTASKKIGGRKSVYQG
jgi:hypothetical protein